MHPLVVHPPSRQALGRAGRVIRFARGEIEVGSAAGSAVVRNLADAPVRGHALVSFQVDRVVIRLFARRDPSWASGSCLPGGSSTASPPTPPLVPVPRLDAFQELPKVSTSVIVPKISPSATPKSRLSHWGMPDPSGAWCQLALGRLMSRSQPLGAGSRGHAGGYHRTKSELRLAP